MKYYNMVEPNLTDTPEMRLSMIMQTFHLVRNAIFVDLHAIRTPEMWAPHYSLNWTLGLAATVSPPIQLTLITDTLATNL